MNNQKEIKRLENEIESVLSDLKKQFSYKIVDRLHQLRIKLMTEKERNISRPNVFQERIEIIQ
jgi:hypothetical protein